MFIGHPKKQPEVDPSTHRISADPGGEKGPLLKVQLQLVTRGHVVLRFCINQLVKDYQQNKSQHADCLPDARRCYLHYILRSQEPWSCMEGVPSTALLRCESHSIKLIHLKCMPPQLNGI